jgi:hypothetical protein
MKTFLLLAGATMLAITAPAIAKQGNGHGNKKPGHAMSGKPAKAKFVHGKAQRGVVRTGNGLLYALDARGSCPPGLAKKNNGCLPPGQARKLYNVGQRYNPAMGSRWSYNQIPEHLRYQNSLARDDRYYYRNGYLYQVDPKTMIVQQAISALLR